MLTVHLRINDTRTRKPTPVRLRISDSAGNTYTPLGRLPIFAVGRGEDVGGHLRLNKENWAIIDGSCEVPLPAGVPLRIQATKGPQFVPVDETVTLGAGQISLRFEISPWTETPIFSADTRAQFITPHAAALEAAAEGVDVANVLAFVSSVMAHDGNGYPVLSNITAFSGQEPALVAHGSSVFVNTLNVHGMLGRLALLNSHRVVHPLAFGEPDGPDDWSLGDWCGQCHRKGGLVVWVEAFRSDRGLMGGEALAQLLLGQVDAIEFDATPRTQPLLPWIYKLWDAGVRVPLVGGSGKESNRVPLGAMRTLFTEHGTHAGFLEAVRAGRTTITNGPILTFHVERGVAIARAESIVRFDKLEVLANGDVLAGVPATPRDGRYVAEVRADALPANGWLAARAVGPKAAILFADQSVLAHSSAVFVGEPLRPASSLTSLRQCLEATREWIETQGRFSADKFRTNLQAALSAAEAWLS